MPESSENIFRGGKYISTFYSDGRVKLRSGGSISEAPHPVSAAILDAIGLQKKRPSILMPRWASRLDLRITAITIERVQDLTEDDAEREGFRRWSHRNEGTITAKREFIELWEKLNGKKAPWGSNPWVWVRTFLRIKGSEV